MDSARVRALESLVAEALLARESARSSPGDSQAIAPMRAALGRALARDALYRDVADSVPPATPADVRTALRQAYPRARAADLPMLRRAVEDSLRGLGRQARAARFMLRLLAGQRVVVDSATFLAFSDSLRALMLAAGDAPVMGGGGVLVPAEAPDRLLERLGPVLERPLARFADGALSLREALEDLRFYLFAIHARSRMRFAAELNERLKTMIEGELMAREAARRGLDRRPDVQRDLDAWTRTWLARRQLERVAAPARATEDQAFRRMAAFDRERALQVCEVDLEEILTGSQAEGNQVRARLAAGVPFDSLARAWTLRPGWAERGGRPGWRPVRELPGMELAVLLAPRDSLVGPGRVSGGWSVFRVLGKRIAADSAQARTLLEQARLDATRGLRAARVDEHVAELAAHEGVRLNYAALARVPISPANMVVKRALGFGGGMLAAPALVPSWGWVEWLHRRQVPRP
jgi:hypothetical protein